MTDLPTRLDQSTLVRQLPLSELQEAARNPRTHTKKQISQIARSIERFGFINPILIDGQKKIVAGHGRLAAAKLLGLTEVPTIVLTHLSTEELRLYALADNRLAELAGWDNNLLAIEFEELCHIVPNLEIEVSGFDLPAIDLMIQERGREPDPEDSMGLEGDNRLVVSVTGDIWNVGTHKIICGDSLQRGTYDALLNKEKADFVISDPPYNVKIDGHVGGLGAIKHDEFPMASGEMDDEEFSQFLGTVANRLVEASVEGALHFLFIDWRHANQFLNATKHQYRNLVNICVWDKGKGGMGSLYRSQHEFVLVLKADKARHLNNIELGKHGRNRTNLWRYPGANSMSPGRQRKLALHPTVKPVAMIADAMLDASPRNGIVLDAFGGSGTTILAAERTGRRARVIEIDPKYVDVAINRWQLMTGRKAVHAESGVSFDEITQRRCAP